MNSTILKHFTKAADSVDPFHRWTANSKADHAVWRRRFSRKLKDLLGKRPDRIPLEIRWKERVGSGHGYAPEDLCQVRRELLGSSLLLRSEDRHIENTGHRLSARSQRDFAVHPGGGRRPAQEEPGSRSGLCGLLGRTRVYHTCGHPAGLERNCASGRPGQKRAQLPSGYDGRLSPGHDACWTPLLGCVPPGGTSSRSRRSSTGSGSPLPGYRGVERRGSSSQPWSRASGLP